MDDFWYMEKLGEGAFGKVVGVGTSNRLRSTLQVYGFSSSVRGRVKNEKNRP